MVDCKLSIITFLDNKIFKVIEMDTIKGSDTYTVEDYGKLHDLIEKSLTKCYNLVTSIRGLLEYSINDSYIPVVYVVHRLDKCIIVLFNNKANDDWIEKILTWDIIDKGLPWIRVQDLNDLY